MTIRLHATWSTDSRRTRVEEVYRPEVITASVDQTLEEAARRMRDEGVSALLVLDGDRVAGIVTERDLTAAAAARIDLAGAVLADHLTADPVTVCLDTDVREIADLMRELEIRHLPVIDGDEVVGMISARDLLEPEATAPPRT